jgi:hypothetical protein
MYSTVPMIVMSSALPSAFMHVFWNDPKTARYMIRECRSPLMKYASRYFQLNSRLKIPFEYICG